MLEPLLNRSGYDPRSAPAFVQNRPVEVRVGILVQSIANFQLATMVSQSRNADMDGWNSNGMMLPFGCDDYKLKKIVVKGL